MADLPPKKESAILSSQEQTLRLAAQDGTLFLGGQVGHAGSVIAGSGGECYSNRAHEQSLRRARRHGVQEMGSG